MIVFVSAADHGGFTAAGRALGMNVSSITKHVARLENELGARLINRTTRSFALTEYGEKYLALCQQVLHALQNGEASLRDASRTPKGRVRVILPISFGRITVIPALDRFQKAYPDVQLEIVLRDNATNFVDDGFDLAVQTVVLRDSRIKARTLNHGSHVTVASPSYLARMGAPRTPDDLKDHRCIIGQVGDEWKFRRRDGSETKVRVPSMLHIKGGDGYREAAVAGLGVAQATWWLFRTDLRSGAVRQVLHEYTSGSTPIMAMFPAGTKQPMKVRAFINFLVEITKEKSAPIQGLRAS
jgi:DNA-binding transcriptional LysR family regulator